MLEEGYLVHGAIESSRSESAVRGDGKTVDVYGHALVGSLRLFVGVCEESEEVRTLIFGYCDESNDGSRPMNGNEQTDAVIADILDRPSGKRAYERRAGIVQVARMVHRWRTDAGLTQGQLAERIGSKQARISKLESCDDEHMPDVDTLIAFAHACGRRFVFGSEKARTSSTAGQAPTPMAPSRSARGTGSGHGDAELVAI